MPVRGLINLIMVQANYIIKYGEEKNALEIYEILNMVIRRLRYTSGCEQSDLWKNEDQQEFLVSEIWKTKEDFDRHVNSILFKRFLTAIEMSTEPPQISISECDHINGIELIEDAMKLADDPVKQ